jgi:phosphosulfolactate synthase
MSETSSSPRRLAWDGVLTAPIGGRTAKPRQSGTTFVSVKGVGLRGMQDLIAVGGDYIDRVKLAFGHTILIDEGVLREKIALLRANDIDVNPGGTCGEIALFQGAYLPFLRRAAELGFNTIEVSDGTVQMDDATRERCIKQALDAGFKVVSEVGKKDPAENLIVDETLRQIQRDLGYGVAKVVIESREGARGIGVFDASGQVKGGEVEQIVEEVDPDALIWEAPSKAGQEFFVGRFGANVNLGNIAPVDVIAVESLRQGLRGDTFRWVVNAKR